MNSCVARTAVVAKSVLAHFFVVVVVVVGNAAFTFQTGGNLISNSSSVWFIRKTVRKSYKVIIRSDHLAMSEYRRLAITQVALRKARGKVEIFKTSEGKSVHPPTPHLPVGCSVRGEKMLIRFFQNCQEHLKWISGHPNTTLPWDWKWEADPPPPPLLFCCCHFHFAYSWGSFWNWFSCYISDGNHE